MTIKSNKYGVYLLTLFFFSPALLAQSSYHNPLFESDELLQVTLSGNIKTALDDRGDRPAKHDATLGFKNTHGILITVPVRLQTRG